MRHGLVHMGRNFERMHPGVSVELVFREDFYDNDFHDLMDELMTEYAPALIQASIVNYPFHEHSNYFADWMPVLANHPRFDENDWNMNVLLASLINNELIAFPAFQVVYLMTANQNIPELVNLVRFRDSITMNELVDLYVNITGHDMGYSFLHFGTPGYNIAEHIIIFHLQDYFVYETGKANFYTEEFISLLETMFFITPDPIVWHDARIHPTGRTRQGVFIELGYEHLLITNNGVLRAELSSLPVLRRINEVVLRAESDSPFQNNWILSTHDPVSQALAAEFLLYMAGIFGHGVHAGNSPFHISNSGTGYFYWVPFPLDESTRFFDFTNSKVASRKQHVFHPGFQNAAACTTEEWIGSMEIIRHNIMPQSVLDMIREDLNVFSQGYISARETARRLQLGIESAFAARR